MTELSRKILNIANGRAWVVIQFDADIEEHGFYKADYLDLPMKWVKLPENEAESLEASFPDSKLVRRDFPLAKFKEEAQASETCLFAEKNVPFITLKNFKVVGFASTRISAVSKIKDKVNKDKPIETTDTEEHSTRFRRPTEKVREQRDTFGEPTNKKKKAENSAPEATPSSQIRVQHEDGGGHAEQQRLNLRRIADFETTNASLQDVMLKLSESKERERVLSAKIDVLTKELSALVVVVKEISKTSEKTYHKLKKLASETASRKFVLREDRNEWKLPLNSVKELETLSATLKGDADSKKRLIDYLLEEELGDKLSTIVSAIVNQIIGEGLQDKLVLKYPKNCSKNKGCKKEILIVHEVYHALRGAVVQGCNDKKIKLVGINKAISSCISQLGQRKKRKKSDKEDEAPEPEAVNDEELDEEETDDELHELQPDTTALQQDKTALPPPEQGLEELLNNSFLPDSDPE
ncbi:uncharacterized protein LOC132197781 isoform X2 [Neocloeon triangulifer]|uniref:uncharacterized protein LOC132197781 isoform X2 n=1 Tax=Neocloeon triangulifer TaxID=2078957 RepID=UPI00286F343C|nr:uncharacterized protein LOC132197781 isoform X2 [Neocloeon triangulifer]